jgi:hypothetical protein
MKVVTILTKPVWKGSEKKLPLCKGSENNCSTAIVLATTAATAAIAAVEQ